MLEIKTISLFLVAALAESDGHYLPHLWPCEVDGVKPKAWDVVGSLVTLSGMTIIMFSPRSA